jgi:putative membrane protein
MHRHLAVPALLLAAVVAACNSNDANKGDTTGATAAAVPAATPAPDTTRPAAAAAPALDDPTIVAIFDAANQAEIETGQLAADQGESKAVKDFGRQLVRDHKDVQQQGRDLAKRLSVTPTPPADSSSARAHAAAMDSLRALKGRDFDRAFLDHEVGYHKAVIDAVNGTLMPAIRNDSLRALVTKVAPAFQGHMMKAQQLRSQMGS